MCIINHYLRIITHYVLSLIYLLSLIIYVFSEVFSYFLDRFLKKKNVSDIRFYENPSSGRRVFSCGKTGRLGEANGRFFVSQFCERT
jgi:hypothetical protein